jgi:hypothetical protein
MEMASEWLIRLGWMTELWPLVLIFFVYVILALLAIQKIRCDRPTTCALRPALIAVWSLATVSVGWVLVDAALEIARLPINPIK